MLDMELLLEGFASAESLHIPVLEFWRRQLLGNLEGPWKTVKLAADFAALLRQLSQLPPGQHPLHDAPCQAACPRLGFAGIAPYA